MRETTFENAKVGDRVWSVIWGGGTIKQIEPDLRQDLNINIGVLFDSRSVSGYWHSFKGVSNIVNTVEQTLFWDKPSFTPPPRPKRKVKKEISLWVNIYPEGYKPNKGIDGSFLVWDSIEKAIQAQSEGAIDCVELKGSYEVEE